MTGVLQPNCLGRVYHTHAVLVLINNFNRLVLHQHYPLKLGPIIEKASFAETKSLARIANDLDGKLDTTVKKWLKFASGGQLTSSLSSEVQEKIKSAPNIDFKTVANEVLDAFEAEHEGFLLNLGHQQRTVAIKNVE